MTMKKTFFSLLAALICTSVFTQDEELPAKVGNVFKLKYPEAKSIYWYPTENCYKIEFEISQDTYTAIYSENGNWIETAKVISDSEVPDKAIQAVKKTY